MKEIQLTQGKAALVDDDDYEWLLQWKWFVCKAGKTWYAFRGTKEKGTPVRMHRVVMNVHNENVFIDHIDGNGLNNRKANLRICTQAENQRNRGFTSRNVTGYKGVAPFRKHYRVRIRVGNKDIHLGMCDNPEDGAKVYDEAARKLFGEFAFLNFPDSYFPLI